MEKRIIERLVLKYSHFAFMEFWLGRSPLSGYEIKSTGNMTGGTVPVPLTAPAFGTMMTQYLFRRYRMWGEHKAAAVKLP